jgi:hypothetical protein
MFMRRLMAALALPALLSVAGCTSCHSANRCNSPAVVGAAPIGPPGCSSCGGSGPPTVVPGPPGAVPPGGPPPGGAYYPPGGPVPFGTSYGLKG